MNFSKKFRTGERIKPDERIAAKVFIKSKEREVDKLWGVCIVIFKLFW